jgi:threonylcarbamoyladenosine tRNA methylthiotransferase MtaB
VARGKASSVPAHEVFDQAYQLLNEGVQEIVLTGINLGTYESEGYTLASLCEEVLALSQGKTRVRIGSVEPLDVTDELMSVLARNEGKVCRHLHLPLQSGSTPVLYAMGRPYTAHEFVMLVERLRKKVPEMSLSTDIIVGFPGETEVDFNATCAMARACRFSKIHVFPYSPREGTPAALMPNQVDAATKAARAKTLRALSRELEQADCAARKGTTEWALVENNHRATTESYHDVAVGTHLDPGSWLTYTWE